jgi:hypothetical protein
MRVIVVGASAPVKGLRVACGKAEVQPRDVRSVGSRAWVELAPEDRDAQLARLAAVLTTGLMVIDIELPNPGDGTALQASRATYRGVEEDVSDEARTLLAQRFGGTANARDLAWALVSACEGGAEANVEEQWAQALVERLAADGSIELRSPHTHVAGLAHLLQNPGRDLGERLLAELIDSTAIDEVFADADQLAAAARATRPKR